jgi:molybdenum cofactor cytidylyltransferase
LILHQGEPLVRRAARVASEAGANPVIVVLGSDADLIARELQGIPPVTTILNREWSTGLASSLGTGLRAVAERGDCDGVLVTLADQPLINAAALKQLIDAFDSKRRITASSYQDVSGVPAVFGVEYIDELTRLSGDAGAGEWLRRRSGEVTRIPLDAGSLDIDTVADLAKLESDEQSFP